MNLFNMNKKKEHQMMNYHPKETKRENEIIRKKDVKNMFV